MKLLYYERVMFSTLSSAIISCVTMTEVISQNFRKTFNLKFPVNHGYESPAFFGTRKHFVLARCHRKALLGLNFSTIKIIYHL